MLRKLSVIAVSSFAVGVISGLPAHSTEDNILYRAVVKLIIQYEALKERVRKLEERVSTLEERMSSKGGYPAEEEISLTQKGVVRTWLRFRSSPSFEGKVLFVLRPHEGVTILERFGDWYKVRTKEGYIGYVHAEYVVVKRER